MSFFREEKQENKTLTVADVWYDEKVKKFRVRTIEVLIKTGEKGKYIYTGITVNPGEAPNTKKFKTEAEAVLAAHRWSEKNPGTKVSNRLFPALF